MNHLSADELLRQATCAIFAQGEIIGTAWLVSDEGHLLTAGHVLAQEQPTAYMEVEFAGDDLRPAQILSFRYDAEQELDFGVLKLMDATERQPLPVSLAKEAEGAFRLYGYGTKLRDGTLYSGKGVFSGSMFIDNLLSKHLFRLRGSDLGESGNSGGAVFSNKQQAVVGIQTEAARSRLSPEADVVLAVPLHRVAQVWKPLQELAQEPKSSLSGRAPEPSDEFYVESEADAKLKKEIIKQGTTIIIHAPCQTGKTSLLMRGLHYAKKKGAKAVFLNFGRFCRGQRANSYDVFLHQLAHTICRQLKLDHKKAAWEGELGAKQKLTYFLEDQVLPEFQGPIVLAMDEVDRLLNTPFQQDFFDLVRAWHNKRASLGDQRKQWKKLNIAMAVSSHPYFSTIHQKSFNVGTRIEPANFTTAEVKQLNYRYGSPVTQEQFPQLITLLGGQPYLTHRALYLLAKKSWTWEKLKKEATTDTEDGPFVRHLERHYFYLDDQPDLKDALTQIIDSNACPDDASRFQLQQAGLIKHSQGRYTCSCELYQLYFG